MGWAKAAFFIVSLGLLVLLGLCSVGNTQANTPQFILYQSGPVSSGGTLSGGGYALSNTLGQVFEPIAMSGNGYQVMSGLQQGVLCIYHLYLPLVGH
jgi:hypothetical protein